MPIAQIQIIEGRTEEQIETMIIEVTQAIARSLNAPPESVRVLVNEVPNTHWGIGGKTAKRLGR
ncbi:MAG: 2-hydroxymuconate tautomerase [Herminiimonas sp.]|nr:2-hydroxymuconate tautomerase [Herminiimonas sp.]MDB5855511.1 2-hydroxymuconate tautomerase [Herminiimonas sp.]